MILIHSERGGASVGLPASIVAGKYREGRTYQAEGNTLKVDGTDPYLVSEDASKILAMPGFRLMTASEQNQSVEEIRVEADTNLRETISPAPESNRSKKRSES